MLNQNNSSTFCILFVALSAALAQAQVKQESCIVERKGTPSALVVAVESGDLEALRRLLIPGVKVDELHYEHETALMAAARGGRVEMVRALLEAGADVNKQSSLGWTALMWAGQKGRTEIIKILLAAGVDVNARNNEGSTALMWAARDGNVELSVISPTRTGNRANSIGRRSSTLIRSERGIQTFRDKRPPAA